MRGADDRSLHHAYLAQKARFELMLNKKRLDKSQSVFGRGDAIRTQPTVLVGNAILSLSYEKEKNPTAFTQLDLAGETRLKYATCGFGGKRYSIVKL